MPTLAWTSGREGVEGLRWPAMELEDLIVVYTTGQTPPFRFLSIAVVVFGQHAGASPPGKPSVLKGLDFGV
ncbi:MAG: hypothetical protein ACM336_15545 [Acidobacteriota bacterium]